MGAFGVLQDVEERVEASLLANDPPIHEVPTTSYADIAPEVISAKPAALDSEVDVGVTLVPPREATAGGPLPVAEQGDDSIVDAGASMPNRTIP